MIPLFLYSYNAAIYHRNGRLVWFSPRWIASNRITQDELLGLRYLEFLGKGEAQRMIEWLTREDDSLITYRYYSPSRCTWTHCTQGKVPYGDGDFWLCLGERWETGNSSSSKDFAI